MCQMIIQQIHIRDHEPRFGIVSLADSDRERSLPEAVQVVTKAFCANRGSLGRAVDFVLVVAVQSFMLAQVG